MKGVILGVVVLVLGVMVNTAVAPAQTHPTSIVRAGSPEAAQFLQKLREAKYADRANSNSYSSDDPSLGRYYARKAEEVSAVIKRLEGGQSVPREEIQSALDNSKAGFY